MARYRSSRPLDVRITLPANYTLRYSDTGATVRGIRTGSFVYARTRARQIQEAEGRIVVVCEHRGGQTFVYAAESAR